MFKLAKEMSNVLNKSFVQNCKTGTWDFVTKFKQLKVTGYFIMLSFDI